MQRWPFDLHRKGFAYGFIMIIGMVSISHSDRLRIHIDRLLCHAVYSLKIKNYGIIIYEPCCAQPPSILSCVLCVCSTHKLRPFY